ncbi:MAG: hemolysin III family protein [Bacillota bacterium]|nr:hemolysin III family protein [Bacillota bacterium]
MKYSNRKTLIINEIANAITHGIGAVLAIAALVILIVFATRYGGPWHVVSFSIYGSTLVLLYLASTLYHSIQNKRVKYIFRIIDHAAIFLLIAGTYTPLTLVTLREEYGWVIFGLVWGLAILGVVLKVFFVNKYAVLSTLFYLLMGWLIVFSIRSLFANLAGISLIFLGAGGLSYTLGIIFYVQKGKLLHHAIWHLFVLAGSICHFFAIFFILPL